MLSTLTVRLVVEVVLMFLAAKATPKFADCTSATDHVVPHKGLEPP
jgi:hypothetical protein